MSTFVLRVVKRKQPISRNFTPIKEKLYKKVIFVFKALLVNIPSPSFNPYVEERLTTTILNGTRVRVKYELKIY